MSRGLVLVPALLLAISAPGRARADVDYFKAAKQPTQVRVTQGRDRSQGEKLLLGGLGLGAAAALAFGAYYNLDSRDAADAVSARVATGKVWSADLQAKADQAHSSGVRAEIGYGVAGAFVIAALVVWWRTEPGEDVVDIGPGVTPTVTPAPGGAMVGATWGF